LLLSTLAPAHTRHSKKYHEARLFAPSAAAQLAQNEWIDLYGLQRYNDDRDLRGAIERGDLVQITSSPSLIVNPRLPLGRRYVRPWVIPFIASLSEAYYQQFKTPLILTSAVRTVRVQRSLRHWNRNSAPAHGDVASSHLAGLTIDLARKNMSPEENRWMENELMNNYVVLGKIIVIEESGQQWCWHICVRPEAQCLDLINRNLLRLY
jgi:hypothetical protein